MPIRPLMLMWWQIVLARSGRYYWLQVALILRTVFNRFEELLLPDPHVETKAGCGDCYRFLGGAWRRLTTCFRRFRRISSGLHSARFGGVFYVGVHNLTSRRVAAAPSALSRRVMDFVFSRGNVEGAQGEEKLPPDRMAPYGVSLPISK